MNCEVNLQTQKILQVWERLLSVSPSLCPASCTGAGMQISRSKLEQQFMDAKERWEKRASPFRGPARCRECDGDCCANVCLRCPTSRSKVNFISWSLFFNWHKTRVPGMKIGCYLKGSERFLLMFYWWDSAVPSTGTASGDSLVKFALGSKDPLPLLVAGVKGRREEENDLNSGSKLFSTGSHEPLLAFPLCNWYFISFSTLTCGSPKRSSTTNLMSLLAAVWEPPSPLSDGQCTPWF